MKIGDWSRCRGIVTFNPEKMHEVQVLNGPTFAHAILKTSEVVIALGERPAAS